MHSHTHPHAHDLGHRQQARHMLRRSLFVTGSLALVEAVGGWWTGSLALMGDAAHMLTDVSALGISLLALWWADRPATERRTFGHQRAEILASATSGLALLVLVGLLVGEAFERFHEPREVLGGPMLVVALFGLAANGLVLLWLHDDQHHMGVRSAFLHVLGDTLSSVGVVIGAIIIITLGWTWIDPLVTIVVAVVMFVSTIGLLREAVDVLMQGMPAQLETGKLMDAMAQVDGVLAVHDLHVWCLTPNEPIMSAHVVVEDRVDRDQILAHMKSILSDQFSLFHSTIQVQGQTFPSEDSLHHIGCCEEIAEPTIAEGG